MQDESYSTDLTSTIHRAIFVSNFCQICPGEEFPVYPRSLWTFLPSLPAAIPFSVLGSIMALTTGRKKTWSFKLLFSA